MLCFLDESGNTKSQDPDEVFVLAGVALPVNAWGELDAEVDHLKRQYGLQGHEIHTTHLYSPYRAQEDINGFEISSWEDRRQAVLKAWEERIKREEDQKKRKDTKERHKKCGPYIHLTREERVRFLKQLCELLVAFKYKYIVVEAWNVASCPKADTAWLNAFLGVARAFQRYLDGLGQAVVGVVGAGQRVLVSPSGVLVHDRTDRDQVMQWLMKEDVKLNRQGRISHSIGPSPLFVDSRLTGVVQLADLVAFAVRKYVHFQYKDGTLFDVLEPGLDHALHVPKEGGCCPCRICARYED